MGGEGQEHDCALGSNLNQSRTAAVAPKETFVTNHIVHLIFVHGLDNVWRPQRQHGQTQVFWQLKTDDRVDFAGAQTRGKQ